MRNVLLSFLLLTTAAIPVAAQAQREDVSNIGREPAYNRERGDSSWRSRATSQRPQAAQPAPAPRVSERRGNWQSRGPAASNDRATAATPQPRRWERSGGNWNSGDGQRRMENRSDDGQRRYGWNRGGAGQQVTPPPATAPQQPRRDWSNEQRERWADRNRGNDRNRWNDRRQDGDRDRWDNNNRRDRGDRRYAYRTPNGSWNGSDWNNRNWNDRDDRYQRWSNDWRRDRRYDWRSYRNHNRDYYRLPRYAHPYGYNYGYRRFSIGIVLDNLFYSDRYWISDPWDYRLPPAYGPYRWVRYYDDVLLVDLRNGRVVDVIYSFFW